MEEGETQGSKFMEKMKKDPMMPIGIVGVAAITTYGLYNFKKRKSLSPSIYLIQLRLAAQGTLIGCLTLGLTYSLFKNEKFLKILGINTGSSSSKSSTESTGSE